MAMRGELRLYQCLLLSTLYFAFAHCHIAFTFPPAREYPLDFLDTFRTSKPCGMAKGKIKTSIPNGSPLKLTWEARNIHKGGYKLELLDKGGNLVQVMSEGEYFEVDPLKNEYTLTIPSDLTCRDCTFRLFRQALEFGTKYQFRTCADIDIVASADYVHECSGHGTPSGRTCSCEEPYFGDRCQYKNECTSNSYCVTSDHGRCIDLQGSGLPQKQCFCRPGYFGRQCEKESSVKEASFNVSAYKAVIFGAKIKFYYRIIDGGQNFEGVMAAETLSFVAVGWRPSDIDKSCHETLPEGALKIIGRDFAAMDCLDIVLGAVRDGYHRIGDYYTRDRSTPQLDPFFGKKEDLLGAVGWEKDGMTYIKFIKPVTATDSADHDFYGDMHVAWAHGRDDSSFYTRDELKYHRSSRGFSKIVVGNKTTLSDQRIVLIFSITLLLFVMLLQGCMNLMKKKNA